MERSKKQKINIRYLLLYFFIYAAIGWLLETFYAVRSFRTFYQTWFSIYSLCPIYGFGAVILIQYLKKYKSNSLKLFCYSAIVFSVFEYIAGFVLDAMFAARWWDYTNDFMNLNGRISIFYSFSWGVIAILFINHIHPFIEKYIKKILKKIPIKVQIIIIQTLLITFVTDFLLSSVKYLNTL